MTLPYIIAVDFDGTLCEEEYPGIGARTPASASPGRTTVEPLTSLS